ncbi:MAG: hypothetical protein R3250_18120, partial [Melioribacteraceae bacterium]|nr:hypothetical protein [Melioribacteraceae bacterium]
MTDLLEEINQFREENDYTKLDDIDPILIKKLHDLYFKDINDDSIENKTFYGAYCEMKGDYDNMIKYYLMAIEKNDSYAMSNLGYYYEKQKDYDNMMKYYLMAIEKGSKEGMIWLNDYFQENNDITNLIKCKKYLNDENMKKYYKYQAIYAAVNQADTDIPLEKDECCICFYDDNYIIRFNCNHFVCYKCYNKLGKLCPS